MPKKTHIFVSYVREDRPYVDRLVRSLRKAGEAVWYDELLLPGGKWKPEIRDRIDDSYAFILCCSTNLNRRDRTGVFKEVDIALSNFRELPPDSYYFFPVCFDDVDLPKIEVYEQQYLQDVFQKASIYADQETQNKEFGRLVSAIRKSPFHPAPRNNKPIPEPEQIPPPVIFYIEIFLQWLLDPKVLVKLGACLVGLIISIVAVGPLVQAGLDHASQDGAGPSVGNPAALLLWAISCAVLFVWTRDRHSIKDSKRNRNNKKPSQTARNLNQQNLTLKDENQRLNSQFVSLRNQVSVLEGQLASSDGKGRMSKRLLWGVLLTGLWWCSCSFVLQELLLEFLMLFDPSFEDGHKQYLAGVALGMLGQIFLVRYFASSLLSDGPPRFKVAWLALLIGLLPGLIWLFLLTPESTIALSNENPDVANLLGVNLLAFNAVEKLVVVPIVSLCAIIGLKRI